MCIDVNARDKAILSDLRLFRVMSRDQLVSLHFSGLKNPINSCNSVLKRLTRDGYIKFSGHYTPYVYFDAECKVKPDSTKIPHFLELVDTVIEMKKYREPQHLIIEPKYGNKGTIEPDLFAIWFQPIFIEVQRTTYTNEVMQKKINLYEDYFSSRNWEKALWQKPDSKVFPSILIITNTHYAVESDKLKIYQAPSISDFYASIAGSTVEAERKPIVSIKRNLNTRTM